jgi:hypothetical protein
MDRCWLKGTEGDALHTVLCAPGFNIRWLMRAIAGQAAKTAQAFVLVLFRLWAWLQMALGGRCAAIRQAIKSKHQIARCLGMPTLRVPSTYGRGGRKDFAGPTNSEIARGH